MRVTVRLNDELEKKLTKLSNTLHKKKSDVIRDAINYYAKDVENSKKSRILNAVEKTKEIDKNEYKDLEGTLSDGL